MAVHRPDRDEQLRKFEQLNREAAELLAELTEPRDIADVEMHKALAMSAIAGSGWEPPAEPSFTLDRAQRAALRRELGIPDNAIVVGTIGRMVIEKGYREFFAAARGVRLPYHRHGALGFAQGRARPGRVGAGPLAQLGQLRRQLPALPRLVEYQAV